MTVPVRHIVRVITHVVKKVAETEAEAEALERLARGAYWAAKAVSGRKYGQKALDEQREFAAELRHWLSEAGDDPELHSLVDNGLDIDRLEAAFKAKGWL